MAIEVKRLETDDAGVLERVADGVFDHEINPNLAAEFLADPRHHIAVAIENGIIVGFVSAVHYVHPDKPTELWINEVGVAPSHHRRGIGKALLTNMIEHGRELGCTEAWVLTDRGNSAAMRLYASSGGIENQRDQTMFSFKLR
jgi:aminoglycoside 6'-N-acetyltransferase I